MVYYIALPTLDDVPILKKKSFNVHLVGGFPTNVSIKKKKMFCGKILSKCVIFQSKLLNCWRVVPGCFQGLLDSNHFRLPSEPETSFNSSAEGRKVG